jgi:hypothetical protein
MKRAGVRAVIASSVCCTSGTGSPPNTDAAITPKVYTSPPARTVPERIAAALSATVLAVLRPTAPSR